jgi:hypothetical protein
VPFAIEVAQLEAPTEMYDRLGEDTPPGEAKTTEVFVVVSTYRNVINWFVLGQMNEDAQSFRDEIYTCACKAHNTLERGCAGYYRGTNSVHVKRHHADAFEAMYNHNHYPLGNAKGADFDPASFPAPIQPDEFRQHIMAFAEEDAKMHDGKPRFLTIEKAARIADEFDKNYQLEIKQKVPLDPQQRSYSDDDIKELRDFGNAEQPCKPLQPILGTRGINAEIADTRQPPELENKHYGYVWQSRSHGQAKQAMVNKLAQQRHKTVMKELSTDFSALKAELNEVMHAGNSGSAPTIASAAFRDEVIAATMEVGLKTVGQLQKLDNTSPFLEVKHQLSSDLSNRI